MNNSRRCYKSMGGLKGSWKAKISTSVKVQCRRGGERGKSGEARKGSETDEIKEPTQDENMHTAIG